MSLKKLDWILFIILLVVFIVPVVICTLMSFPSASDDIMKWHYTYGYESYFDYFSQVKYWYMNHNGRYFNMLIVFLPFLYYPLIYGLFNLSMFFALIFSLFLFAKQFFIEKLRALNFSIFLVFAYFIFCISPVELFFNVSRTSVYELSLILNLLLLYCAYRLIESNNTKLSILYLLLIVLLIGNMEPNVPMVIILGMAMLFIAYKKQKPIRTYIAGLILTIPCTLLLVLSPGIQFRTTRYENSNNMIYSSIETIKSMLNLISSFFHDISSILAFLGIIIFASFLLPKQENKRSIKSLAIEGGILLLISTITLFIFFWAKGHELDKRYSDYVLGFLISGIAYLIINYRGYISSLISITTKQLKILSISLIAIVLMSSASNSHYQRMFVEFKNGSIFKAKKEIYLIDTYIMNNKKPNLLFPKIQNKPKTLMIYNYFPEAYQYLYGFKKVKKTKKSIYKLLEKQ